MFYQDYMLDQKWMFGVVVLFYMLCYVEDYLLMMNIYQHYLKKLTVKKKKKEKKNGIESIHTYFIFVRWNLYNASLFKRRYKGIIDIYACGRSTETYHNSRNPVKIKHLFFFSCVMH